MVQLKDGIQRMVNKLTENHSGRSTRNRLINASFSSTQGADAQPESPDFKAPRVIAGGQSSSNTSSASARSLSNSMFPGASVCMSCTACSWH